jgi:hypothetical protein
VVAECQPKSGRFDHMLEHKLEGRPETVDAVDVTIRRSITVIDLCRLPMSRVYLRRGHVVHRRHVDEPAPTVIG